jgi:hypothetical protein
MRLHALRVDAQQLRDRQSNNSSRLLHDQRCRRKLHLHPDAGHQRHLPYTVSFTYPDRVRHEASTWPADRSETKILSKIVSERRRSFNNTTHLRDRAHHAARPAREHSECAGARNRLSELNDRELSEQLHRIARRPPPAVAHDRQTLLGQITATGARSCSPPGVNYLWWLATASGFGSPSPREARRAPAMCCSMISRRGRTAFSRQMVRLGIVSLNGTAFNSASTGVAVSQFNRSRRQR